LIAPEAFIPMRAGTGEQGVFEHVDSRAELPPQSSAQCRLHRVFSHNVSSFVLLFSQITTKAVTSCPHIGYREMQRQVEDQLGPSFSHHAHRAASPTVKPESHDPPPLCARGVNDNGLGAEEHQGATSLRNPWDIGQTLV
jgi:hypothetical protein